MPARKGDRPFVGITNEARKLNVSDRREKVLGYLRTLSERISVRTLAAQFNVSLRTIMYDLDFLFKNGHAEELRPKFLEAAHITASTDKIETTSVWNQRHYKRGKQLRSAKIHYDNLAWFSRGRLSYVEYQTLDVLKKNPGTSPRKLYDIYLTEYYRPCNRDSFYDALHRLVSLRRAFAKPISAKQYIYYAYPISLRSLECRWASPAPCATPPKHQQVPITNFNSYVGKAAHKTIVFTNRSKNKLIPVKSFYVEFNKSCECGGPITTHRDGVRYCDVCGLVEQSDYMPGIENTSGRLVNAHTRIGFTSPRLGDVPNPDDEWSPFAAY